MRCSFAQARDLAHRRAHGAVASRVRGYGARWSNIATSCCNRLPAGGTCAVVGVRAVRRWAGTEGSRLRVLG